jgi:predicted restriction endonuclease
MSDLPPVISPLEKFEQEILELKRGRERNHQRPHKLVMLLSVIELMDTGILTENRIYLSEPLITTFKRLFNSVKRKNDLCQVGPPFFHLRSSGFWFHKVRPQRQNEYGKLTTTGGGQKLIQKNIEYAYLRDDVFEILQNSEQRERIRLLISWLLDTSDK